MLRENSVISAKVVAIVLLGLHALIILGINSDYICFFTRVYKTKENI